MDMGEAGSSPQLPVLQEVLAHSGHRWSAHLEGFKLKEMNGVAKSPVLRMKFERPT